MKTVVPFLLLVAALPAAAQRSLRDSLHRRELPVVSKYYHCNLRVCTGIQTSGFADLGFSYERGARSALGFGGYALYAAFSSFPSFRSETASVFGVKAGADYIGNGLVLGLELAGYRGAGKSDLLVTPKAGFGFSLANLVYGYGFSTNGSPFGRIGRHTLALQFNLPLKHREWTSPEIGRPKRRAPVND